MKLRWPWWRRTDGSEVEARACLEQLEQRDVEVRNLGVELREAQRRNHFSIMVNEAIARTREN